MLKLIEPSFTNTVISFFYFHLGRFFVVFHLLVLIFLLYLLLLNLYHFFSSSILRHFKTTIASNKNRNSFQAPILAAIFGGKENENEMKLFFKRPVKESKEKNKKKKNKREKKRNKKDKSCQR